MPHASACRKLRRAVPAIAASLPAARATAPSEPVCPPVAEYDAKFQARAADELELLPPSSVIERMLADYHVMRQPAKGCRGAG